MTLGAVHPDDRGWTRPTRLTAALYAGKAAAHRARRAALDIVAGPPRFARSPSPDTDQVLGESSTPLLSDGTEAELPLQHGKVRNLGVAALTLDGVAIPAGGLFSFWRHVGPPTSWRGYVPGRMLQEGCIVPAVGGGLCQLSNALYDVALQAGCRIVERHPHSRIVPGSAAALGRDATVAWNYVDLRFIADQDLHLIVRLDGERLVCRLLGAPGAVRSPPAPEAPAHIALPAPAARSCGSCDQTDCFRHGR